MELNVKGRSIDRIRVLSKTRSGIRNRRINEKGAKSRAENELWRNVAKNMYCFDWRAHLFPRVVLPIRNNECINFTTVRWPRE